MALKSQYGHLQIKDSGNKIFALIPRGVLKFLHYIFWPIKIGRKEGIFMLNSYELLQVLKNEGIEALTDILATELTNKVFDEKSTAGTDASRKRALESYKKKADGGGAVFGGYAITDGISAVWLKHSIDGIREEEKYINAMDSVFTEALKGIELFDDIRESLRVWYAKGKPKYGYMVINDRFYSCENVAKIYNIIAENNAKASGRPKLKMQGYNLLIVTCNGAGIVLPLSSAGTVNCTFSDFMKEWHADKQEEADAEAASNQEETDVEAAENQDVEAVKNPEPDDITPDGLEAFAGAYADEYNRLYNSDDGGYKEISRLNLLDEYDEYTATDQGKKLLLAFVKHRQDYLTSDRECAAFILAADDLNLKTA